MFRADNTFNLLIAKVVVATGGVQINDASNATTYIADGEIVCLGDTDQVIATPTYTTDPYIRFVQRSGATTDPLVMSQRIHGSGLIRAEVSNYSAAVEQITYMGFNGTTGSIDDSGTDDYAVRITLKHNKDMWSQQANQRVFKYTPNAATTQKEIAADVAIQISDDDFTDSEVRAERQSDGTFAVLTNACTLAVVNGSKVATASAANHGLVAGDIVRIGSAGETGGGAATDPVYLVTKVVTTAVTLDQIFQGTSGTVLNVDVGEMTAVVNWGVRLTGEAQTFTVGKLKYVKVVFDLNLQNYGTTEIDRATEAARGNGTYEEVAELEYMAVGFDGVIDRVGDSKPDGRSDADSAVTYDTFVLEYFLPSTVETVSGSKPARQLMMITVPTGGAQRAVVLAALNAWIVTVPGAFPVLV